MFDMIINWLFVFIYTSKYLVAHEWIIHNHENVAILDIVLTEKVSVAIENIPTGIKSFVLQGTIDFSL